MSFEAQKIEFELPKSGRKIVYRSEKLQDDVKGLKIATEAVEDKTDRTAIFYFLQKVKVVLCVVSLDGSETKINSYKEFQNLADDISKEPQDMKTLESLYVKMNGDAEQAEAFVKNLLSVKAS